ncbi:MULTISPECIES: histidinol-phosphate transaminase [Legionella]|uniref:Histidinol-phosphate aminotransferase n=1 Tax=Legionella septentrionalis TaxID=2498109 RepID=A0A433JJ09_9GAMM|nr:MULTISPECIES: histidinol-phosphate transaminase [Legionella]MCP0912989.1 histidinol-phosphate transaminase [Legionella sp. 27cVA30]RUQ85334.1 histidinol-phosphate transaminase [Legionella septentrionalis]RUQ96865.1 histidinol-phosphate transaminase [Legionella septentrionalis]RUR10931.1 histidinol-phosphate transaminase [Legionella septentrionalis]RUR15371.1 histidinol-phosphate transaminase [Legionella septentrionalis]
MPCDYHLLPHEGIQTLSPYIPGKSAEELAREQHLHNIIKLASNENPLGCSPNVIKALAELSGHQLATYPAPATHPLRKKIAQKLGLDAEMIILGNGTDLLFPLMLTCFALHRDKHLLLHQYAFISYAIHAKTQGIPVHQVELKENWEVDIKAFIKNCTEDTALIFLANPNNPTGSMVSSKDIKFLLENIPESTILVLDEAYYEYVSQTHNHDSLHLLSAHSNLIITRTFSKAYGLAGLRIGYAIAHPDIISILLKAMPPFTVSQTALVAAAAALDDDVFIKESVLNNTLGLEQMIQGLKHLNLSYLPPAGNFITINCTTDAAAIYQALQRHGIIVRPLHPYGLNHYLRVTIGTAEQNERFLATLALCMAESKEFKL